MPRRPLPRALRERPAHALPHPGRHGACGQRHQLRPARRRAAGRRGRERVRQERDHALAAQAAAHAAGGDRLGPGPARRRGSARARPRASSPRAGRQGGLHLPGPDGLPEPGAERRLPAHRAAAHAPRPRPARGAADGPRRCWSGWASLRRRAASATSPTSSRAGCASA